MRLVKVITLLLILTHLFCSLPVYAQDALRPMAAGEREKDGSVNNERLALRALENLNPGRTIDDVIGLIYYPSIGPWRSLRVSQQHQDEIARLLKTDPELTDMLPKAISAKKPLFIQPTVSKGLSIHNVIEPEDIASYQIPQQGYVMKFGAEWWDTLTREEKMVALAHEIGHICHYRILPQDAERLIFKQINAFPQGIKEFAYYLYQTLSDWEVVYWQFKWGYQKSPLGYIKDTLTIAREDSTESSSRLVASSYGLHYLRVVKAFSMAGNDALDKQNELDGAYSKDRLSMGTRQSILETFNNILNDEMLIDSKWRDAARFVRIANTLYAKLDALAKAEKWGPQSLIRSEELAVLREVADKRLPHGSMGWEGAYRQIAVEEIIASAVEGLGPAVSFAQRLSYVTRMACRTFVYSKKNTDVWLQRLLPMLHEAFIEMFLDKGNLAIMIPELTDYEVLTRLASTRQAGEEIAEVKRHIKELANKTAEAVIERLRSNLSWLSYVGGTHLNVRFETERLIHEAYPHFIILMSSDNLYFDSTVFAKQTEQLDVFRAILAHELYHSRGIHCGNNAYSILRLEDVPIKAGDLDEALGTYYLVDPQKQQFQSMKVQASQWVNWRFSEYERGGIELREENMGKVAQEEAWTYSEAWKVAAIASGFAEQNDLPRQAAYDILRLNLTRRISAEDQRYFGLSSDEPLPLYWAARTVLSVYLKPELDESSDSAKISGNEIAGRTKEQAPATGTEGTEEGGGMNAGRGATIRYDISQELMSSI